MSQVTTSHKQRTSNAHPLGIYTFNNYLAYIFYPPLYIAGPIITFNDFMWQVISFPTAVHSRNDPLPFLDEG